jgi:hypothetical protein
MSNQELVKRCQDVQALVSTGSNSIDKDFLHQCSHLKIISQFGAGYDNVDVQTARQLDIHVGNAPDAMSDATADIAFILMLAASRKVCYLNSSISRGEWGVFKPRANLGLELKGKTLGIFGLGRIGYEMATRCRGAYGMHILYCSRSVKPTAETALAATKVSFDELGDPGTVLSKVNLVLSRDNAESMFVTIFYAVLDLQTGVLSFSSAGHDDGLLLTRANACEPLRYMGPAIGLVETVDYPTETRSLSSGDTLLLLTDGITEAFNIDGRVFGPDSVVKSATQTQYTSAVDLVQSINDEVGRFSAGTVQSDDITCVGLRFKGRTLCT